jgi:hypothetical protein
MSLIAGNLGFVQRLLDSHQLVWGICAGAAAHLYGNRRPIQDVDVIVMTGKLNEVVQLLQGAQKAVQFDGNRILWRGIKVFDDLSVRRAGISYPYYLDETMHNHMRRMSLLGAQVMVLAPEDVLLHKLLLGRGPEENKHDQADAEGIVRRQKLDIDYLRERAQLMRATHILQPKLVALNIEL